MASARIAHGVTALLEKMRSQDADFRYMALNDLIAEARKETFLQLDEGLETQTVNQVLELMNDKNGEVKNMAVRCLGILVKKIREKQMQVIIDRLVEYISSKEEELRDIASLGLKTVTAEIPANSTLAVSACQKLTPKLLAQIGDASSSQELLIDSLDILAEVFTRFSATVAQSPPLQKIALSNLLQALGHSRPAVRKRALTALGALGACSSSEIFTELATHMAMDLKEGSLERTRTVVQLVGTLARTCPRRLGRRLPEFMPRVISTTEQDDDELREVCLQTMESILLRCPTEATPFVNAIVEVGVTLIKHDPNYAADDDEDDEMEETDDEDEDDDLVDEDYSDDDDVSWKVRRASAKVLSAVINTRSELLSTCFESVAPTLVSRFSEREESVRLEVLNTFLALLKQTRIYGGSHQAVEVMGQSTGALKRKREDMEMHDAEGSPRNQLRTLVPPITKNISKQLGSKSIPTRYSCFAVLRELVVVLRGGLDAQVGQLVEQIEKALKGVESASGPNSNLKAEVLVFLRLLFQTHSPRSFEDQLGRLVPILVSALDDKLHRNASEAFQACSQLIRVLRPLSGQTTADAKVRSSATYKPYVLEIYEATIARLVRPDSDQEIKERGISCLGVLLAHAGDDLSDKFDNCLSLLLDRLRNEVTRFVTVKVLAEIVSSPVCQGPQFDQFVHESIGEVADLLRKSNRALKLAAFDCLAALLKRSGQNLQPSLSKHIVPEIQPLLSDADMNLLPIALQVVALILKMDPSSEAAVQSDILPEVYVMVRSPLMQGPALDALLEFFKALLQCDRQLAQEIIASLMASLEQAKQTSPGGTHAYTTVARCIGAVVLSAPQTAGAVIGDVAKTLNKSSKASEPNIYFSLLLLGEIGRVEDFSKQQDLFDRALSFYTADSEEVKSAAAFAVGNMAVGNLSAFLPVIEQHIKGDDKRRFLSLHALKELITHASPEQLSRIAEQIWVPLFDNCETKEEGTRNIGAECLARLTLTDPAQYLIQLQERLHSPSASTRSAVIAAVRFTLTEASTTYDEFLAPLIVEFLSLLRDPDLDVRRHTMFALNSAAHNKPHLIRDHLSALLPLLYEETHLREELLRKVSMGPFTVTTDDGLDLRKNAFETMYTLLDTCLSKINIPEYMGRVIAGLRDEDGIKILSYLMLVRLASLAPVQVAQHLDDISEPISATLKVKLKDNATKQEVERASELQRSVFRSLVVLDKLSSPVSTPKFAQLIRETKASDRAGLYRDMEAAQAGQKLSIGNGDAMDIDL